MHRRSAAPAAAVTVLVLSASSALAASSPVRRTPRTLPLASHRLVVIADDGVLEVGGGGTPVSRDARVTGVLASLGLTRGRRVGPVARPQAARRERIWALESDRPGFDPVQAARALEATGMVRAASPDYRLRLFATTPNDLYLIYQWYVDDGGFADVRLPDAWDMTQGDSSVVIAIIDTGVDTSHPDLAAKIWHNPGEIPGNGIDDDGNGLIDDTEGWDFGSGDNDPDPEYTMDPASGIDVGFHGTFCAGIAAAATNNDEGIAGAGWKCRILPLKASNPDSGLTTTAVAGAFAYAVDEGASVISMSFGAPGDPGVPEFFQTLVDMATAAGTVCVAAAGNDGDSVRTYPAACDRVLSVGATDSNNARASFSNYGPWVDVAAPGSSMWSTICQNYTLTSLDQLYYEFLFGWDGINPYMYGDGTSFACPLTAGVCGLVRARFPSLTPGLVIRQIVQTGDAITFDEPIGPKLNAFRAVSETPTAALTGTTAPRIALRSAPNPAGGPVEIRFQLPAAGRFTLSIFDVRGRRVRTLADGSLDAGPHRLLWDGCDDRGDPAPGGVYFSRLTGAGIERTSKVVLIDR
jgi:subtilisin family serine protease